MMSLKYDPYIKMFSTLAGVRQVSFDEFVTIKYFLKNSNPITECITVNAIVVPYVLNV